MYPGFYCSFNYKLIFLYYIDHVMKDVVITVPVYYNQAERKAIIK